MGTKDRTLSIEDLAELITAAGREPISADDIAKDIAAGAPANKDGTVDPVHYAAWLVRELNHGRRQSSQAAPD